MTTCENKTNRIACYLGLFFGILVLSLSLVASEPLSPAPSESIKSQAYAADAGSWRYDAGQNGWRYLDKSGEYATGGWLLIDDTYYCFDSAGLMRTGWIASGNRWYYCAPSGAMATGWRSVGGAWYYFMPSNGAMATGWTRIDGTWYYLNGSGVMQTGWQNIGGNWYYLASSGAMQTGWLYAGGAWYYLNPSGVMATGWRLIDGSWYHLGANGVMDRGWFSNGTSWYYLGTDGKAAKEWTQVGGAWYYFNPTTCKMAANQFVKKYWVNSKGVWDSTQYSVAGLITRVNQARNREGIPTLKWSDELAEVAAIRAREAATLFSHTRPNGQSCFTIYPPGLLAYGENLAAGPNSAQEAHEGWMNSPSHRACLLDKDFNVMGAACVSFDDGYNYYWVESFGHDPNL